jgi:transcriptional regulator with XRE-family HTH domain
MDSKQTFQKRIKELRLSKNMSMDELASALCIKKSRINMWENYGNIPTSNVLIRTAKFFNVSIDYLLGNEKIKINHEGSKIFEEIVKMIHFYDDEKLEKVKIILELLFAN